MAPSSIKNSGGVHLQNVFPPILNLSFPQLGRHLYLQVNTDILVVSVVFQVIMVRLQRVTFMALHNYLGLSHELINPVSTAQGCRVGGVGLRVKQEGEASIGINPFNVETTFV